MRWSTGPAGMTSSQLRSLQDWFLRYELKSVPGVAEVASIGGMVKQYQVAARSAEARRLRRHAQQVVEALQRANQETGGSVLEMAEAEYMVRAIGLSQIASTTSAPSRSRPPPGGVPVSLGDVATVQLGPEMRRGIAELNGEGEVAGGVIVLRQGKNAREVIDGGASQARRAEARACRPASRSSPPMTARS